MWPLGLEILPKKAVKKLVFELEKTDLVDPALYKIFGIPYQRKRRQTKRARIKKNQTIKFTL